MDPREGNAYPADAGAGEEGGARQIELPNPDADAHFIPGIKRRKCGVASSQFQVYFFARSSTVLSTMA